jgi:sulfite oxidase
MRTELKEVSGIDWNDGACCNCIWRGPLLADVLAEAGITLSGDGHVCFDCSITDTQDDDYYGASVPLSRCLDPTKRAILALEVG